MTVGSETHARRVVSYRTMAEFLSDVDRLAAVPVRTLGNWTFAQIIQHLAESIRSSFDGYSFKAPWFARHLIAPLIKNRFLTKTMRAGFQLPKKAGTLLPRADVPLADSLAALRKQVSRMGTDERAMAPHPFLGRLASQEWTSLHLRHAELHMSYVEPL